MQNTTYNCEPRSTKNQHSQNQASHKPTVLTRSSVTHFNQWSINVPFIIYLSQIKGTKLFQIVYVTKSNGLARNPTKRFYFYNYFSYFPLSTWRTFAKEDYNLISTKLNNQMRVPILFLGGDLLVTTSWEHYLAVSNKIGDGVLTCLIKK